MAFEDHIKESLEWEGGYVNHKDDLGGETNYGITKRYYPNVDIKNLTLAGAIEIYKQDYWDKNKIDSLPEKYRGIYFDMCINMGQRNAGKVMQRAINDRHNTSLVVDGIVGRNTLKWINKELLEINRIQAFRVMYYVHICIRRPKNLSFFYGWFKRAVAVK